MPSAASPSASACALATTWRGVRPGTPAAAHSCSATALAATACISGPPWSEREDRLVDPLARAPRVHTIMPPRGPRSTLCVVKRDHVGVRHRRRDRPAGDQADEVRGVDHQPGADLVGDLPERGEVDQPRVGRRAADDHLRPVLEGQVAHLVVVDQLGVLADAVGHGVEPLAGEVDLRAVGEVAAVRQDHREHRVARLQQRGVGREVGARAGVRLQVGVLGRRTAPWPGRCRSPRPGRPPAQPP